MSATLTRRPGTYKAPDKYVLSSMLSQNVIVGPYQYLLAWDMHGSASHAQVHVSRVTINADGGMTLTPVEVMFGITDAHSAALFDANKRETDAAREQAKIESDHRALSSPFED
jgi:hypothetical protein